MLSLSDYARYFPLRLSKRSAAKHARPAPVASAVTVGDGVSRAAEVTLCCAAILALAPLMLFVAALVHLQDGGPVIFRQRRVGRGGRPFSCLKFRTMAVDAEQILNDVLRMSAQRRLEWEREHKLRNDPRVTRLGAFLRRTSIDELPQLFNVLKGEMSLVGPRPIVEAEINRYGPRFKYYTAVRPGITGLWQVSGRNDLSYRTRVAMDVTYVRTRTAKLDLRIMLATVYAVVMQRGSY